jgi:hypothetical protein
VLSFDASSFQFIRFKDREYQDRNKSQDSFTIFEFNLKQINESIDFDIIIDSYYYNSQYSLDHWIKKKLSKLWKLGLMTFVLNLEEFQNYG